MAGLFTRSTRGNAFILGVLVTFVGPLATAEPSEAMLARLVTDLEAKIEMKFERKMASKLETAIHEATETMRVDMQSQIDGKMAEVTELTSQFEQLTSQGHRRVQTTGIESN